MRGGAGGRKSLTKKNAEITEEKPQTRLWRSDMPLFLCAYPFVGFVFFVVKSFLRRRGGRPRERLV